MNFLLAKQRTLGIPTRVQMTVQVQYCDLCDRLQVGSEHLLLHFISWLWVNSVTNLVKVTEECFPESGAQLTLGWLGISGGKPKERSLCMEIM